MKETGIEPPFNLFFCQSLPSTNVQTSTNPIYCNDINDELNFGEILKIERSKITFVKYLGESLRSGFELATFSNRVLSFKLACK